MSTKKHFRFTESAVFLFNECKVEQYQSTKNNSVPAESFEVVFFYVVHKELYYEYRNYKSYNHTCDKYHNLLICETAIVSDDFEQACTEHYRNGKIECKFSRYCS